jgi:phosphoserine phosphatase
VGPVQVHGLRAERRPELVPDFVKEIPAGEGVVVFDADGTLWRDDVADDFTQWMIETGEIPGDRWPDYMRIYAEDHPAGCRYLLTLYEGMCTGHLRSKVDEWWLHHARRAWIPEAVESLYHLRVKGFPVWIVSGTPTDFLMPMKEFMPVGEVIGMDFELDGEEITGRHSGISCAGEGKAEKMLMVAGDRPIVFCAGNGSLDGPMMEAARQAWSVYPNPEFEEFSRSRGWPVLPRPPDFVEEEKFLL